MGLVSAVGPKLWEPTPVEAGGTAVRLTPGGWAVIWAAQKAHDLPLLCICSLVFLKDFVHSPLSHLNFRGPVIKSYLFPESFLSLCFLKVDTWWLWGFLLFCVKTMTPRRIFHDGGFPLWFFSYRAFPFLWDYKESQGVFFLSKNGQNRVCPYSGNPFHSPSCARPSSFHAPVPYPGWILSSSSVFITFSYVLSGWTFYSYFLDFILRFRAEMF